MAFDKVPGLRSHPKSLNEVISLICPEHDIRIRPRDRIRTNQRNTTHRTISKNFQFNSREIDNRYRQLFTNVLNFCSPVYSCSLWDSKLPVTGTLYITDNYLCFASFNNSNNLIVPFVQIQSLKKITIRTIQVIYLVMVLNIW